MLTSKQIKQLAKTSSIKGIKYYQQRIKQECVILSGEEKRLIIEEMEKEINKIKGERTNEFR